jgi:hypothetical protein
LAGAGIGAGDGFLWELGTPYTLNISLLEGNASGALFGATITNEINARRDTSFRPSISWCEK